MPRLNCSRISWNSRCSSPACGSRRSIRIRVSRGADSSKIIEPRSTKLASGDGARAGGAVGGGAGGGAGGALAATGAPAGGAGRMLGDAAGVRAPDSAAIAAAARGLAGSCSWTRPYTASALSLAPGPAERVAQGQVRLEQWGPLAGPERQLHPLLVMMDGVGLEGHQPVGDARRTVPVLRASRTPPATAGAPRPRGPDRRPGAGGPRAPDGGRGFRDRRRSGPPAPPPRSWTPSRADRRR